jgi:uncharacterized protein YbjT (DUF2867 family)
LSANDAGAPLRGRSVLVTSGYLGTALIERLLTIGSSITGVSRTRSCVEVDHWEAVDLHSPERIDEAFRRCRG